MRKTSEKGRNLHRARFSPLTGLLLLLSFFLLDEASTSVAQTPPQQVKIAYASSGINYADWFLAKEKGYFREEGLEPQFIQMRSSIAINAGVTGELHGQASIGSAIRAIQRGAPLRVVAVTLRRPLYWLVVRPEYRSVKELKGKVLGITTIGGSQHTRAKGMLASGRIGSGEGYHLGSDQRPDHAASGAGRERRSDHRSEPSLGRCRPGQVQDEYPRQRHGTVRRHRQRSGGFGQAAPGKDRSGQNESSRRGRRATAIFWTTSAREASSWDASIRWTSKLALESYRASMPAFTRTGIPTEEEIKEHLAEDARVLQLATPAHPEKIFDFTLQRAVLRELGLQ